MKQDKTRLALRILLAPDKRLTDHFVLIRADDMPQKSLASFLVNERGKRTALQTPPGVQLDRKFAMINTALKRWRILQTSALTDARYTVSKRIG